MTRSGFKASAFSIAVCAVRLENCATNLKVQLALQKKPRHSPTGITVIDDQKFASTCRMASASQIQLRHQRFALTKAW